MNGSVDCSLTCSARSITGTKHILNCAVLAKSDHALLNQPAIVSIDWISAQSRSSSSTPFMRAACAGRSRGRIARGVTYEEGTSEELLQKFYRLMVPARRRQGIPPQPLAWFRNLIACMRDRIKIRLASYQGKPASSMITIRHKRTMTYKYGVPIRSSTNSGACNW